VNDKSVKLAFLNKNKWLIVAVAALVLVGVMTANYQKLEVNYEVLQAKYEELNTAYEELSAKYESETKTPEAIGYSHHYIVPTYDIAAATVTLAKGEVFQAHMLIQKANKRELMNPSVDGAIVFWIWDPHYRKIIDAGRISGVYDFSLSVEESGDYILVFEDSREGECIIFMDYNSPTELRDASVRG
jgi:hypothetical protein